jgi:hypothetical protein
MGLKRTVGTILASGATLSLIGVFSNVLSVDDVEKRVQRQCEESIVQVERLWRLPTREIRRLPSSVIRMRTGTTDTGKHVVFQLPPSEQPPYWYAHVKQAAPFILRVQYGWATNGTRMEFGQGGEQWVLSIFGKPKTLCDRPEWYL